MIRSKHPAGGVYLSTTKPNQDNAPSSLIKALMIVMALYSSGCATIIQGTKAEVTVESPGAQVRLGPQGTVPYQAPATFQVERGKPTSFTVTRRGFEEKHGETKRSISPIFLTFDLVTCALGCLPLVVDAMSGAWYDVEERYSVSLKAVK